MFDDGDRITHSIRDISAVIPDEEPQQVQIGQHVITTWKGGHKYYIGYVSDKNSDGFKVTFDDNDEDFYPAKQLRIFPNQRRPHKGKVNKVYQTLCLLTTGSNNIILTFVTTGVITTMHTKGPTCSFREFGQRDLIG